jgi:hypothetical protein
MLLDKSFVKVLLQIDLMKGLPRESVPSCYTRTFHFITKKQYDVTVKDINKNDNNGLNE